MTEIDELEGKELAEAVALKRGMTKATSSASGHAWFDTKGNMWTIADKEPGLSGLYRPDRDIVQAWELGEGWIWGFQEHWWGLRIILETPNNYVRVPVNWADFPTKAQAYATARCRAFLKAKAAM